MKAAGHVVASGGVSNSQNLLPANIRVESRFLESSVHSFS